MLSSFIFLQELQFNSINYISHSQTHLHSYAYTRTLTLTYQGPLTDIEISEGVDVTFVPCDVCGQAVPATWPMRQHRETLKPLVGIRAECIMCSRTFTEHRALRQHLNFCRIKVSESSSSK